LVNGKKVDIASYRVRVGEEVTLSEKSRKSPLFEKITEKLSKVEAPGWLGLDPKKVSAKVLNAPTTEEPGYDAKSIIEFYSR
jgi:small subunit ribosomal protein S4